MTKSSKNITPRRLSALRLLSDVQPACLSEIADQVSSVSVARGELVIERGQHLNGFYGVLSGILKLYMLSCDGHERVIRLFQANDSFGEAIMFNDIPSPVFVEAIKPTELVFFKRETVLPIFTESHDFALAMVQGLGRMLGELLTDLECCCLQNARQRTIGYLCALKPNDPHVSDEIELPASKTVVASILNLSAETFSRELHALENQGLIRISRRVIHLNDRQRLIEAAESTQPPSQAATSRTARLRSGRAR